jgi:hypothetical protein
MKKLLILILFCSSIFISCNHEVEDPEIVLPSTPIMTGTTSWGVVNVSYLKINKEPDNNQHIVTTLRKGDLVKVESVHYINNGKDNSVWYNISRDKLRGWVQDSSLNSYSTREKAQTASAILLKGED